MLLLLVAVVGLLILDMMIICLINKSKNVKDKKNVLLKKKTRNKSAV